MAHKDNAIPISMLHENARQLQAIALNVLLEENVQLKMLLESAVARILELESEKRRFEQELIEGGLRNGYHER